MRERIGTEILLQSYDYSVVVAGFLMYSLFFFLVASFLQSATIGVTGHDGAGRDQHLRQKQHKTGEQQTRLLFCFVSLLLFSSSCASS